MIDSEDEARSYIADRVSRETFAQLETFVAGVIAESEQQNLISATSRTQIWCRHVLDSFQLLSLAPEMPSRSAWLDIGTGAGFPGVIAAIVNNRPITLVEPRRRRADFLATSAEQLGLTNCTVVQARTQDVTGRFGVVSARAVASLAELFTMARHLVGPSTLWLLPKGRSVHDELAETRRTWQGSFHVEPSITSAEAHIVVATGVKPR